MRIISKVINKIFLSLVNFILVLNLFVSCSGQDTVENPIEVSEIKSDNSNLVSETDFASDEIESEASELSKQDLIDDYNQFWTILKENYPYYEYLAEKGMDYDGLMETGATQIKRISDAPGLAFVLNQQCRQLGNFAHLAVVDGNTYSIYKNILENGTEEEKENYEPWLKYISDDVTADTYELMYPESETDSINSTESVEYDYPEIRTRYIEDCSMAVFIISLFDYNIVDRDSGVVEDYIEELYSEGKSVENIVFDLTSCSGGADNYWAQNIVKPFGGNWEWEDTVYFSDSEVVNDYFVKYDYINLQDYDDLAESNIKIDDSINIKWYSEYVWNFQLGDEQYSDARRWVLINHNVYSSSEKFVRFCKETGWAELVGSNTTGDGSGPGPVFMKLDNTGLLIQFSADIAFNDDGTLNAEYGTSPNYLSDLGEELDRCIEVAKYGPQK